MARVIAVTNQKGGVGKTTTSINVAYFLSKMGKRTLIIDFDPQGNATSGLGIDKQELGATMTEVIMRQIRLAKVVLPTEYKDLYLAPSTSHLANELYNPASGAISSPSERKKLIAQWRLGR